MSDEEIPKLFTLDEAQALLPLVESLLKRGLEAKETAQTINTELRDLAQRIFLSGGMRVDPAAVARRKAEMEALIERAREALTEIHEIGVQVKDIELGLLDFPCRVDDEIVLLCWKLGEEKITHWHTLEAGFAGRKPLDARFGPKPRRGRPN